MNKGTNFNKKKHQMVPYNVSKDNVTKKHQWKVLKP